MFYLNSSATLLIDSREVVFEFGSYQQNVQHKTAEKLITLPKDQINQLVKPFYIFIDIIKIFDMKAEEFYEKYHFYNDNLLEKKNFKNKKEMKELIESGIIPYLEKKIARTK